MIHPDTQLKWLNDDIGYGVVATAPIPVGTIIYVQDDLEIVIPPQDPRLEHPGYRAIIEKYACLDPDGNRILSWDIAKHVNHCCHANTLSTAYGFEIAVRDIAPGEEITDEYALFTAGLTFALICRYPDCRRRLADTDLAQHGRSWDAQIQQALRHFHHVPQPLLPYLPTDVQVEVRRYLETGAAYKSVLTLQVTNGAGPI